MSDVDFQWVMQTTFSLTIVVGAPLVAALSLFFTLPGWEAWVNFAIRVCAAVWLATALCVYGYARWVREPTSV
ncbi:DUF5822 domain-containing protein [Halocalculus aciditolerans]|uniref:Uncharacterized protein n=1 Tax=Halocalculus aciditolerans TaxID=1383812 RepID=A0A830FGM5_9EURY|nr:DUF5822 domain-containing protein [Halocalculus aciditolerans]GGL53451.1 hypothetical protein GCM10009039_09550 [Halocalculus aciditolerans]